MKVFALTDSSCCGEHADLVGLFSTRELAEAAKVDAKPRGWVGASDRVPFDVEEWIVDDPLEP